MSKPDRDRPRGDKPNDKPDRDRPGNKPGQAPSKNFRNRASRDVAAAYQPQYDALDRQQSTAEAQSAEYQQQIENLYNSLSETIGSLGPQYQAQVDQITQGLQSNLGSLASSLPGGLPSAELAGANGAFGAAGAAGLSSLSSQALRGAGYNTSALRQTAIDSANYQTSVLADLQDFRKSLDDQRMDLASQQAPLVLSRVDELRDRADQLALANKEFKLRQSATQAQIDASDATAQFVSDRATDASRPPRDRDRPGNDQPGNQGPGGRPADEQSRLASRFLSGKVMWDDLNRRRRGMLRDELPGQQVRSTRRDYRYGSPGGRT